MTDKVTKLLSKLSKGDLKRLSKTVEQITKLELEGLDIKALKGQSGVYRVRVGDFRIIFSVNQSKRTKILSIGRQTKRHTKICRSSSSGTARILSPQPHYKQYR